MESEKKNQTWTRLCFLLSPEDSSAVAGGLPAGVSTRCCRVKTLVWVIISVVGAILIGQL